MRKSSARGRVLPQRYSIDRRIGRLSLKAWALFPLMWVNADDQGRLSGEPEEIKYACCPNIDDITKWDIPALLDELTTNQLIMIYSTSSTKAIQLLDWWDVHRPQWAWPSLYPPPQGWPDHLRYKKNAKEVITVNWFSQVSSQVDNGGDSGEKTEAPPLTTPLVFEQERGEGRGRGKSPECSGEESAPSPSSIGLALKDNFPLAFGREPTSREKAYLRDIEKTIVPAGATTVQVCEAYREAADHNKLDLSYVRAILFAWLGISRAPP